MSKLSRKAILAVLSLVLTFVALGATTFAWFSLGTTATVNPFDLEVRGSEGLEIQFGGKADGTKADDSWYTTLNSTLMNGWLTGETGIFADGKLDAVTTTDGINFVKLTGVIPDSPSAGVGTVTTDIATENGDYLEFKLNFRTKDQNKKLNIEDVLFVSTGFSWAADVPFKNENGVDVDSGEAVTGNVINAVRLSFEEIGKGTATTFQAPEAAGNVGLIQYGAHNYVATKHGLNSLELPNNELVNSALSVNSAAAAIGFSDTAVDEYYTTSVIVRVWIEGWDGNAYDAIFGEKFTVSFKFELV